MLSYLPIATAVVTGLFILVGYFVQKYLDRLNNLADKRREAYTMYFKSMFANMDKRSRGEPADRAAEVYWRSRVVLYASDEVVRLLGELQDCLRSNGSSEGGGDEILMKFDALLLAMRKETVGQTRLSVNDIRHCSPILSD